MTALLISDLNEIKISRIYYPTPLFKILVFLGSFLLFIHPVSSQDYGEITHLVDTVKGSDIPGSIFPFENNVVPLISGIPTSKDIDFPIFSVATTYGNGRVIAIGHEGMLADHIIVSYDNIKFAINSMNWLNSGSKRILIKMGWLSDGNLTKLKDKLENEGFIITFTSDRINSIDLTNYDIILFGNVWNDGEPYSDDEITTVVKFVEDGGGIFIAGLGWSFNNLENYAMNSISEPFGFKYVKGIMWGTSYFTEIYPETADLTLSGSLKNIQQISAQYSDNLPSVLQNNDQVRRDFTKSNIYLRWSTEFLTDESKYRDSIYSTYTQLMNDYPVLFKKGTKYDIISETSLIWNRERIHANLRSSKKLTYDLISEIGNTLGLENNYLEIWESTNVLLLDNSSLDEPQLKFAKEILTSLPRELYNLGTISFSQSLGETYTMALGSNVYGSVNTFSYRIGQYPENQFPNDVSQGVTAVYCAAMAHEINHVVDGYIYSTDKLNSRREQLIKQAGSVSLNYLRSNVTKSNPSFFVDAPQEFFASISNQWFTDSEKVLELGLIRFDNQYKEPINQFLFFTDVYSLNTDSTIFYKNDLNGNFSSYKVPIKRDLNGNINQVKIDSIEYNFEVDNLGNVVNYSIEIIEPELYIEAPGSITVNNDSGYCFATINNLGTPVIEGNYVEVINDAPNFFMAGETIVIWTVTDNNGNFKSDEQIVTVIDDEDPVIEFDTLIHMNDMGECFASFNITPPVVQDNCEILNVKSDAPSQFLVGETIVNWTVTDINNNQITSSQIIIVIDNEEPTLSQLSDIEESANIGECGATIDLAEPIVADNCGVVKLTNNAPILFPIGITYVTWSVTDLNGIVSTSEQKITIIDDEHPLIEGPDNISLFTLPDKNYAKINLEFPNTSDNCDIQEIYNDAPDKFYVGETLVTWSVTDINGNLATAEQMITVIDNQPPFLTAPSNIEVIAGINESFATITDFGTPTASDNCGIHTITNDLNGTNHFMVGTHSITWIVTDINGNVTTAEQTVTVLENTSVSTDLISDLYNIVIYPNPATNYLKINLNNRSMDYYRIKIYNIFGQQVLETFTIEQEIKLDVQALNTGLYFVQVINDSNEVIINEKLIIN